MGGRKPSAAIRQRGHAPSHHRSHHFPDAPPGLISYPASASSLTRTSLLANGHQDSQNAISRTSDDEDPLMSIWGSAPLGGGSHRVTSPSISFQSLSISGSHSEPSGLSHLGEMFDVDLSGSTDSRISSNRDSEVMKYIKKLESRIESLELQNNELKTEVHVQRRRSNSVKDFGGTLRLSAATPEFRPLMNATHSPPHNGGGGGGGGGGNRARSKSAAAANGDTKSSSSAATTGSSGSSVMNSGNQALNETLSKLNERLATLEGRQSSIQKKIACFDRIFGPSVPNWQKNVKDLLTRVGSVSPIQTGSDREGEGEGEEECTNEGRQRQRSLSTSSQEEVKNGEEDSS